MSVLKNLHPSTPLTRDLCHQWVEEEIFRFRPSDYGDQYPNWPGMVGIEIEMLPIGPEGQKVLPLFSHQGSSDILCSLSEQKGWQAEFQEGSRKLLRVLLDKGDQITFEPGGQIEFSSIPYPCLSEALGRAQTIQKDLQQAFRSHKVKLRQLGINPWQTVEDIGLQMQKPRYQAMDQFYQSLGPEGARMMRQTCTVQVNLDFGADELTLAKRYLAAQLLAPFATALFAYSPYVDGKKTPHKSHRAAIWQGMDRTRRGFPSLLKLRERLDKAACVEAYLESLLAGRVTFIEGLDYAVQSKELTLARWLEEGVNGVYPVLQDFLNHLSLHFLEVRPRGFMELRSIDCQSVVWQEVPAAFYTGLLYDEKALDQVLLLLKPEDSQLDQWLYLASFGLENPEIYQLARQIAQLVVEGFSRLPSCFHGGGVQRRLEVFLEHFTLQQRTPADDLTQIDEAFLDSLEEKWWGLI